MKPIVTLYNLGRTPYVKALRIQQLLFDRLKNSVVQLQTTQNIQERNCLKPGVGSDTNGPRQHLTNIPTHHKTNQKSLNQQDDLSSSIFDSTLLAERNKNCLLLVEHEPVYTVGIRTRDYNNNYVEKLTHELDKHGMVADFVRTNRGGLITFHGPGQLVAYPIIYLGDFASKIPNKSVKAYVSRLESTIIDTLTAVGLEGAHTVREYPGVWLEGGDRKIAFIGISCKRYVTMHGVSINCDCDLTWFDHIVSCGIQDKAITSIRRELLAKLHLNRDGPAELPLRQSTSSRDTTSTNRMSSESALEARDTNEELSRYDYIAGIFCESFSKNFECELELGDLNQDLGSGEYHSDSV